MNELFIGILGSLIATVIVSFLSRDERTQYQSPPKWRWFWRLSFLAGKLSFFYGLIVIAMNLAVNMGAAANNIAVGSTCLVLGLIAWFLGYVFK